MGFVDRYIHALSASSLQDDARHSQAEPLLASALASTVPGDLGALLHRAKYAGTTAQDMTKAIAVRDHIEKELVEAIRNKDAEREADCRQALAGDATVLESGAAHLSQLLRLWTAEVMKRGRARRWVPENTAWDTQAAIKLYHQVAQHSLAHWLDSTCKCCCGTGLIQKQQCRSCNGAKVAAIQVAGAFILERVKDMVSELQGISDSHASRASAKMRVES